jgi:hypothetical protein
MAVDSTPGAGAEVESLDAARKKDFTSPHLHYFNAQNLKILFEKYDFVQECHLPLAYYLITGLWYRIRCKSSLGVSIISWLVLTVLYPLFRVKADCFVSYFTLKREII